MSFLREADAEPLPGYRLIEPLGHGGFGEVWKCEARGGLFKAIKFVYGNLNSLDMDAARAEQELKALQRIKLVRHPFVVSLDLIDVVEGELVIVMELADKSLHDVFVEEQSVGRVGIPRDTLLRYLRDAAEALDHMNEKHGLQHLDVKPRNLFLVSDRVKVADFGLVKHLERQQQSGLFGAVTPLYAPPETFSGKISDRSDQYSLAIVYQELLTGQRPFNGKNPRQLAQQHMQEEPDLRALPEAERPIVGRALAKDPTKRFPSCMAFLKALYSAPPPRRGGEAGPAGGKPVKTMRDTLEDFQLEQVGDPEADEPDSVVDLGSLPEAKSDSGSNQLGMTIAQPDTGVLRPTVLIGLGSFGRRALMELRCRCLDRFGDLGKVPLFRFLYIDPDGDAARGALRGTADLAMQAQEVYHLPLQPASHYRKRQLDQLHDWLPQEKLYSLPRSLKPQGSRALARLAFASNYQRLLARLKRDVQQVTHPDTLYRAVTETGLALRDSVPRVFVIASAAGGSSGFLADLGYTVRRLLQQLRHPDAQVTALLFCGAPDDPATQRSEQANVYATLTEINHFQDASVPFSAQYGSDGPRIVDNGPAFDCAYLVTLANRTPEARQDAIAHLGSYLLHEMTTPLGVRLERSRLMPDPDALTPFRSLGTYAVWFPRGLLLRLAARRASLRLLNGWLEPGEPTVRAEVQAACARALADPGLRPEALAARIDETVAASLDGTAGEALTALLANLEEQTQQYLAQDDPASWARQALARVQEWLGYGVAGVRDGGVTAGEWRKSRLTRALEGAAERVADEWGKRLSEAAHALMELPGRRLAAAEAALGQFRDFCEETIRGFKERRDQQTPRVQRAQVQLEEALAACVNGTGGGWGFLFGGKPRRPLRVFMDHLAAFARQCLADDLAAAVQQFYVHLSGRLAERLQDISFCRQRLRHLVQELEAGVLEGEEKPDVMVADEGALSPSPLPTTESFWEAMQQSRTARVVLPDGERDLERAAARFTQTLTAEHWAQLDQAVQDRVLGPLGGLQQTCLGSTSITRGLAVPLLEQLADLLSSHLPVTDVADAERNNAAAAARDLSEQIKAYWTNAAPSVTTEAEGEQESYLLVPASEAGKAFGEAAEGTIPGIQIVRVAGQADLTFLREQGYLRMEALQKLIRAIRPAYEEAASLPQASPHSRFDIIDWIPLDP